MPSTSTDRIDGLTTSVAVKAPCVTVATSNITLSGLQTIGGVALAEDDRVLVIAQTTPANNGIYNASSGTWTRAKDFDGNRDARQGTRVLVALLGAANAVEYELTSSNPVTIGQSSLTFVQRYGANAIYDRTSAEISAGVTPTNTSKFASPWKDISRFVSDNTGVTDVSAQFANALAAEKNIVVPDGTYNLGTTGLVLPNGCRFECAGRNTVIFKYSGVNSAFNAFGKSRLILTGFTIDTSASTSATGMRFGNAAQHIYLSNIEMLGDQSSSNTGNGMFLDASNPGAPSLDFTAIQVYCLGYKFGAQCTGADPSTNTWTEMSFLNCSFLGKASAHISGSRGLKFDANTNGVGSTWEGGTIEGYDIGLEMASGSYGLDFVGDIEDCTTPYTVGNTFGGNIFILGPSAERLMGSANGSTNLWFKERHRAGQRIIESWLDQHHVMYDSSGTAFFDIYRGASLIDGGSPTLKFRFATGNSGADNAADRNYMLLPPGTRFSSGTGSPESAVTAIQGSMYLRTDGGAGTTLYIKESGSGNTGWVAK